MEHVDLVKYIDQLAMPVCIDATDTLSRIIHMYGMLCTFDDSCTCFVHDH